MLGLEIVVAVGTAVLVGSILAKRLRIAAPIVLVAVGLVLAALPELRDIGLPPEIVLLLFLPPLLFYESVVTSAREARRFIRGITISGTLLVAFTAAAVAVAGHAMGLEWSTAWIIGAAVAPTDATAVASLGHALPRGRITVLRAESLINDGTALVIYALALSYATSHAIPTAGDIAWSLVRSFGGGTLTGLLVGWAGIALTRRVSEALHHSVLMVILPFAAYLLAEEIGASGVVAVVTVGFMLAQAGPRFIPAYIRAQTLPFWGITTFLLNGALFVLIGLQLPAAIGGLESEELVRALLVTAVVYATTLVGRFVFLHLSIFTIRALDRRPQQRLLRTTPRGRILSVMAGFRGAVSLAVALSVPESFDGAGYPARDMIVFVTAGVVVASLVIQGLALPRVIAWAHLPEDTAEAKEERIAVKTATKEALAALPRVAYQLGISEETERTVREEYAEHMAAAGFGEPDDESQRRHDEYARLRLAMIASKRATVVRLRDERVIDDTVLRRIQARLDVEEIRLEGPRELE